MSLTSILTDIQDQVAHIVVLDKAGIADMTTVAAWTTADATVATVTPDAADPIARAATISALKPGQVAIHAACGDAGFDFVITVIASADSTITATLDAPVNRV